MSSVNAKKEEIKVFIEIPTGSSNKYEFDQAKGEFVLDRVLFSPVHYPADYGYIPETLAEDGDALDVLVMVSNPTFPDCTIRARPVGALVMADDHGPDTKILAVPLVDPRLARIDSLEQVGGHFLKEMEYFFSIYKELEGKKVVTSGWRDAGFAWNAVYQARKAYAASMDKTGGGAD